jgi:predicted amidohydrolase YtcJ
MKILYNANIHTLNSTQPKATAIAIYGDRIKSIGSDREIITEFQGYGKPRDLLGNTVIPGLIDAHIHIEKYSLGLKKVNCETNSRSECLRRVAERANKTPHGEWVLGHGWNQHNWSEGFGNTNDLDALVPNHPVYLTAKSLHAAWVNSAALHQAGIDAYTQDPPGGRVMKDEHGKPDGILLEDAMELVSMFIPEATEFEVVDAIHSVQPDLWRMGITGVHDFDSSSCFSALQILNKRGDLRLRVIKSIPLDDLHHAVEIGLRTGFGDNYLRIGSVKLFADGALGPQTAAMLQPYEGEPDQRGILMMDLEEILEPGRLALQHGLSLAIHAIGDRANHEVLNAFTQLRKDELNMTGGDTRNLLRHRIEHVQVIHPNDSHRLADLEVIASMQPIHATSDMNMADRFWGERSAYAYAWREQLEHGGILAFGSDAPVEDPNPFLGLHAAVTRRRLDGTPGESGWYPAQKLTVTEALAGYTTGPAFAAGMEDRLGKLAPGYLADLLVLDVNPFDCDPHHIRDIHPTSTMVGGEWVWQV